MKKITDLCALMYRRHNVSAGALILRLILGAVFILHGSQKLGNMAGTVHFFATLGLPAFAAYFVSWAELVGGILILLGFLVKPAAVALMIDMAVVVWGVPGMKGGFFWGHEMEFSHMAALLALYFIGPGRYSLAHLYRRKKYVKEGVDIFVVM